jgi:hypothetical protein
MVNGLTLHKDQTIAVGVKLEQFLGKEEANKDRLFLFGPQMTDLHLTELK